MPNNRIPILDSSHVLMSPRRALLRFENIKQRFGLTLAVKSDSFQKAREDWIAGVFYLVILYSQEKTILVKRKPYQTRYSRYICIYL